jgi:hypothetical protein
MRLPFFIETQLYKILKPQIVTIVETFIDGKPSKKFYGKSLVGNFIQWLYAQFNQNDGAFALSPDINNTRTTCWRIDTGAATGGVQATNPTLVAGAGVVNQGIVVGSAAVVPTPASFNVGTLIANGVGAGQLSYTQQSSIQGNVIAGQNTSFKLQRTWTNGSGGNVTVKAVAIYTNATAGGLMLYLDSVSPDDIIPNGNTYTVIITFQITT